MSASTIGALRVVLGLDTAQFTDGLTAAQKHLKGVGASMQKLGAGFAMVGAGMTATITAPLIAAGFAASKAATEAADAMGQVTAAMTSMGNASGRTKEQMSGLADGLMRNSLYDDDDILRQVTTTLVRFGTVSGQVFDRAQQAAVDYAAATKKDLAGSATLVGRALSDPEKAASRLARAGIILTESQEKALASMVKVGNVAGAQNLILSALEGRYKGAAKAAQDTDPYDRMRDSINTLSESMGGIINRYLTPMLDGIAALADRFNGLSPQMQNFAVAGLAVAAALGPALVAIGAVVGAMGTLTAAFAGGGVLAGIVPLLGPIGIAVAAVAIAFMAFKDDIIPVIQSFGAALQEHVGPKLKPLFEAVAGMVQQLGAAFSAFFSSESGSASENLMSFGRMVAQVFGGVVDLISGAINTITQIMRAIGAALNGDWSTMWNALGSAVAAMTHGVLEAFRTLFPGVLGSIKRMVDGVREELVSRLTSILDGVIGKVRGVGEAFFKLYDAVVGHSYVPDLVTETGQWFAKLQSLMVDPVAKATKSTADKFREMRDDLRIVLQDLMTDQERAALALASKMRALRQGLAMGALSPAEFAEQERRARAQYGDATAETLTNPGRAGLRPLTAIEDLREAMGVDRIKERIAAMRDDFADAFAGGLDAALRGDWVGVLQSMFGGAIQDSLRNVGSQIFDLLGLGQSGMKQGGGWGNIGKIASSLFSKLPKFASGGSILPGGSGGTDSQLVQFWKSPHERVDIGADGWKPGGGAGGGPIHFDMRGAVVTADLLAQAQQMANESGGQAVASSRQAVPADRAQSVRYRLGMRAG